MMCALLFSLPSTNFLAMCLLVRSVEAGYGSPSRAREKMNEN
jgi:hypothetical protein